jgi:hypothetical protein
MERELTLRIILESPPVEVDFGVQKGRGSEYETIQRQRSKGKDLYFELVLGVKDASKSAMPTLIGPFVQGPLQQRFIYSASSISTISTSAHTQAKRTRAGVAA